MTGVSQQTVSARCKGNKNLGIKEDEIQTPGGLQGVKLIPAKVVFRWMLKDNLELAAQMGEVGATIFLHKLAGYQVHSTAIHPKIHQPVLTTHQQVKADLDVLQFCLEASGLRKELAGGVMLNYAGTLLPQLKPAINEAHAALAATTPIDDILLTPTRIGEQLGVSARKVNLVLLDLGYQIKNLGKTSKDEPAYFATDIGKPYASNTLATGRLYDAGADNTSYQHLKWKPQIIDILREQLVGCDL